MGDFFDNIEIQEQIIPEDIQQEEFCIFKINTYSDKGIPDKDVVDLYNCAFIEKLVKRNLNAIVFSNDTIRYDVEASEVPQPDIQKLNNPDYIMPSVVVKVYSNFGTAKDVINFIFALAFMKTSPSREMFCQTVYYGDLSYIKFNYASMFVMKNCNANQCMRFRENFNNLVYIVNDILGYANPDITKIGEIIRYLGQWPFRETTVTAIVKEHMALLDNYNTQLQNDYTDTDVKFAVATEEQEKTKREYEYPTFLHTKDLKEYPLNINNFFCESNWRFISSGFYPKLNYENLYKLLKQPPQSVMTTLSVSNTVELIDCCERNMLWQTISPGWQRLWKNGVVVLNGFNNPKCKFTKQNLVDTLFDEEWYKLPDEFKEIINLDVLKTLKTPKKMSNCYINCIKEDDMTGCTVIHLGHLLVCGVLKEITLGLYGTRGRIAQQLQKIFSNIKISDEYYFYVEEKKD